MTDTQAVAQLVGAVTLSAGVVTLTALFVQWALSAALFDRNPS